MELLSSTALLIYLTVLFTSWFSGVAGMGGGIILLAILSVLVPASVLIPLHAMLLLGTTLARGFWMRQHILWPLALQAGAGILVGVWLGAHVQVSLSPDVFYLLLGLVMLLVIWFPKSKEKSRFKLPMVVAGFIHGAIAAVFGSGGVMQAVISRLKITRHQRVATFTVIMFWLNINKVGAFTAANFDVMAYLAIAVVAGLIATLGSYLGKLCLDRLSEYHFDIFFKGIVTLLALRLVFVGGWALLGS